MDTKNWWASKTVWLNVLTFVVAVLVLVAGKDFPVAIPEDIAKYILGVVAILNLGLRFLTDTQIK